MAVLGAMALIAWWMAPVMMLGAAALFILSEPALALVDSILAMAQTFVGKQDPEQAAKTAEAFSSILKSAVDISLAVIKMSAFMALLGGMALIAWWMAPIMMLGADALFILSEPALALVDAILAMAKTFVGKHDPEQAAKTAEALSSIFKSAGDIAEEINNVKDKLAWLGVISLFLPWIVGNLWDGVAMYKLMTRPVVAYLESIYQFGQEIMAVIKPEEIDKILKVLNSVGDLSTALDKAMEDLQSKMSRKQMSVFGWLLKYGIFGAIVDYFPKSNEMKYALNIMKTTVGVLMEMSKMIDVMGEISTKMKGKKMDANIGTNMRNIIWEAMSVKAALKASQEVDGLTDQYVVVVKKRSKDMQDKLWKKGGSELAEEAKKGSGDASLAVNENIDDAQETSSGPGGWMSKFFGWISGTADRTAQESRDAASKIDAAEKERQAAMNRGGGNPSGANRANMPNRAMGGSFWVGESGVPELVTIKPMNATSVGAAPTFPNRASTAPSVGALEKVEREQASITASNKGDQTVSMGKLEDLNSDQVTLLESIKRGIDALVASMKPSGSIDQNGVGAGRSYDEALPTLGMTTSPNWSSSLFNEHPSTGIAVRNS